MSNAKLTPTEQRDIERACALIAAADQGPAALAAEVEARTGMSAPSADPYADAFAVAANSIGYLLDIIDALTGGAPAARGIDSESWTCLGCGGQFIGRRPDGDRCRDCETAGGAR